MAETVSPDGNHVYAASYIDDLSATEDFAFEIGNSSDSGNWSPAPRPSLIAVSQEGSSGGCDRVTIIWPDNATDEIVARKFQHSAVDLTLKQPVMEDQNASEALSAALDLQERETATNMHKTAPKTP